MSTPTPLNVPGDMVLVSPVECGLKVGDEVVYTNDYGVQFQGKKVRGFCSEQQSYGGLVYLEPMGAWWFPVKPESLARVKGAV